MSEGAFRLVIAAAFILLAVSVCSIARVTAALYVDKVIREIEAAENHAASE